MRDRLIQLSPFAADRGNPDQGHHKQRKNPLTDHASSYVNCIDDLIDIGPGAYDGATGHQLARKLSRRTLMGLAGWQIEYRHGTLFSGGKTVEQVTKSKLMADVNVVLADAEELLRQAAQASGEQAAELRRRAQAAIVSAKSRLGDAEQLVADRARSAAEATDGWVHDHPWTAVGVAAGLGFLAGLVLNRR